MERIRAVLAWLATPIVWLAGIPSRIRELFPFSHDGRQTLVYLIFAGSGPAATLVVIWAMKTIELFPGATAAARLTLFAHLAEIVATALLVIVIALACFVSIRAIKIGKDGISAESNNQGDQLRSGDQITVTKDPDAT